MSPSQAATSTDRTAALRDLLGDRVVTDPAIAAGYAADAYPQAQVLAGDEFTVIRARTRADVETKYNTAQWNRGLKEVFDRVLTPEGRS